MKRSNLALAVVVAMSLSACGSMNPFKSAENPGVAPSKVEAIKDTTVSLSTEFKREGVTVYYTLTGEVDRIESKGFAEVWRGNYEHVAEAEAKEKLVKFLRGETVNTSRKTQVIAKSIERAQDNTLDRFKSTDGKVNVATVAEDVERDGNKQDATAPSTNADAQDENSKTNTALRKASINNAQIVTSTITVTSAGRLTAVRKLSGVVVNDGKLYVGTYIWTPKDQKAARSIVRMMDTE